MLQVRQTPGRRAQPSAITTGIIKGQHTSFREVPSFILIYSESLQAGGADAVISNGRSAEVETVLREAGFALTR